MIRLYLLPDPWGMNPSPFCLKLQVYCRLAGIAYEPIVALPFRAPRGKLPYMDDDGTQIADSGWIIDHLKRHYGDRLDQTLSPQQRALGHLIRRTCEESLYFVLIYSRWIDPEGWRVTRPAFFGPLPFPLRPLVATLAKQGMRQALHGQGIGRHTPQQIYALGAMDLSALAVILDQTPFAVGEAPTSFDASLYGTLANIIAAPMETALKAEAQRHPSLSAYVERMRGLLAQ